MFVLRRVSVIVTTVASIGGLPAGAQAAFPGDNGKIVFERSYNPGPCFVDLVTVNADGSGETNLTPDPGSGGTLPAWSPDGKRLAFNGCPTSGINVMNADATGRVLLAADGSQAAWSPNGAQIAFIARRPFDPQDPCEPYPDLFVMNDDGQTTKRLTADGFIDKNPDWSPGGAWIVWGSAFYGYDELCTPIPFGGGTFLIHPDGTDSHQIDVQSDGPYDWSPDGTRIVWSGSQDLRVTTIQDGFASGELNLTNTPGVAETEPSWSPDGTQIAYTRGSGIWVMNADGSNQHQITFGPGGDRNPDWQPILGGYARPRGATPMYLPLVPAAQACTAPNRTHGAPLLAGSCSPPSSTSSNVTVSFGELYAKSIASVNLKVMPGTAGPPDDADVAFNMSVTNVMKPDRSDYTGELRLELPLRITDNSNSPAPPGGGGATVSDTSIFGTVPCTATADTTLGARCALSSTIDALVPGAVQEGSRAIWALGQIKVHDGGADGDADTPGDNQLFEVQGVFVP
jgi:Tol biopolymer transport system component